MNISLENWLRNKLDENESMHDFAVATDTIRCWIDEWKQLNKPDVSGRSEQLKCVKCGSKYIPHLIKPLTICDSCADSF